MISALACLTAAGLQAQDKPDKDEKVGLIDVAVRLRGLYPAEVTVEEGWYQLRVDNQIVRGELPVELSDGRLRLVDKRVSVGSKGTASLLRLRPGQHTLTVGGDARWSCQLTVLPRKQ